MGVHGLWELLAPVGRRVSVELLSNKKLAIDASIWIVQFLKAMRDDRGEVLKNAHLLGFFRRICKLLYLRVKPVFVFDGGTPYLKRRTVIARRRQREQAQSKIRKTAEKLLLNHLKSKKLEELVREESQHITQTQRESTSDDAGTSQREQENADALLAASLAKEWEQEDTIDLRGKSEDDDEQQQILPVVQGKVDPTVLASLPPSMQLRLLDEMREHLVAENRQKFARVAKAPASFSQLQIEAYLKTVAFRRDIDQVQKAAANRSADGVPSVRIASESNREYIFSTDNARKNDVREEETVDTDAPELIRAPSVEKATEEVQTYFDDKGRKRVSRIRGMGVRMTRDLQWNLYLMKDKEAREKEEKKANSTKDDEQQYNMEEDEATKFEKLVSEERSIIIESDEGDEARNSPKKMEESSLQISFVDDGTVDEDDEMFKKLVLEEDEEGEDIEWEEEVIEGNNKIITTAAIGANEEHISDKNIQISFVDNGETVHDDDDEMFKKLISEDTQEVNNELRITAAKEAEETIPGNAIEGEDGEEIEWEDEVTKEKSIPVRSGISEEDAQIEEAIRRSLVDYGAKQVFEPLRIQEPAHEIQEKSNSLEVEAFSKGKGLLQPKEQLAITSVGVLVDNDKDKLAEVRRKQAQTEKETEHIHEQEKTQEQSASYPMEVNNKTASINDGPRPSIEKQRDESVAEPETLQRRETTDEEERFLQEEEAVARRAFIDEEREKLRQEEDELLAERKKQERNAESVSNEMFSECQELLQLFGLPYVIAPMEAEAQCAFMDSAQLVDGVITDDSDVFLFGGRSVYKNIFDGHKYVETYYMKDAESELGLNREKLIRMAMLLGSDYTEGISGIGIVNAIEVVNAFPEEDGLEKLKEWIDSPDLKLLDELENKTSRKRTSNDIEGTNDEDDLDRRKQIFMQKHRAVSKNWTVPSNFPSRAVLEAYSSPQVDKSTETFTWGRPDLELLRKFCWEKFGWTRERADELLLPVLKEYDRRETQLRLDAFYSFNQRFAKIRSTRIQKAVTGITGKKNPEIMFGYTENNTPTKKKPRKKQTQEDGKHTKRKRATKKSDDAAEKKPRKRQTRKKTNPIEYENEGRLEKGETGTQEANVENTPDTDTMADVENIPDTVNAENITDAGNILSEECDMGTAGGFIVEDNEDGGGFVVDDETNLRELEMELGDSSRGLDGNGRESEWGNAGDVGMGNVGEDRGNEGNDMELRSDLSLVALPGFRRKRKSTD